MPTKKKEQQAKTKLMGQRAKIGQKEQEIGQVGLGQKMDQKKKKKKKAKKKKKKAKKKKKKAKKKKKKQATVYLKP